MVLSQRSWLKVRKITVKNVHYEIQIEKSEVASLNVAIAKESANLSLFLVNKTDVVFNV